MMQAAAPSAKRAFAKKLLEERSICPFKEQSSVQTRRMRFLGFSLAKAFATEIPLNAAKHPMKLMPMRPTVGLSSSCLIRWYSIPGAIMPVQEIDMTWVISLRFPPQEFRAF